MLSSEADCLRASELQTELVGGNVPTDRERAFLEDHLRSCAACRLEQVAAKTLRFGRGDGPVPPMDELARRRFVSDAVSEALAGLPAAVGEAPK